MNEQERSIFDELLTIVNGTRKDEKHRGYHLLPQRLYDTLDDDTRKPKFVFYERERLAFIKSKVDVRGKTVLDIGCNTGYILFDLLDAGAAHVTGYEGKATCADYLVRAIDLLGEKERFEFHHEYFSFTEPSGSYDAIVLFNVLHHVGDDYGDKTLGIERAKEKILEQLNGLSTCTTHLIYQMGFNWQGNIKQCLFDHGTKAEMIDFITQGTKDHWTIEAIGVPEKTNGVVVYNELNDRNIERVDALGEFLNRPIFILRSKK